MPLILRIHTYRNQPAPALAPGRFSESGGTLGRALDNTLVLEDPSKYISRTHAKVSFREGHYYLEDLGSNPSIVNDRPAGKGRELLLGEGDRIVIGDYQLEAQVQADSVAAPLIAQPLFEPMPVAAPAQLAGLFDTPVAPVVNVPNALPDALAGARLLDLGADASFASSQNDPLGLNLFGSAVPLGNTGPGFGVHDLNPPEPFRAAESDHLSPELASFSLPPATARSHPGPLAIPDDYDLLADFAPTAAPSRSAAAALVPATGEVSSPAPAPTAHPAMLSPPVFSSAGQAPLSASPFAGQPSASDSEILQALLRGLGLPDLKLESTGPQMAENIGAMLREATSGTMDVLMARALTKKESRMDMTMMAVRSNNPLKFFPNVDSALTQLLSNTMAGYMPPVQAMASAFDDLKAHELSVIAGMRAALSALLQRFDPAQIERRTPAASVMDKMSGSTSRKARMWEQIVEIYSEVATDVDEVQGLFGDKFSAAYEEQVDRLRRGGK
ncbi:MAG TPA: type VI secretion system-associated FHA domain protein TagH [Pseudomonas sp.]|jgi:FHA domain-containing protein/type VI secretion system protein